MFSMIGPCPTPQPPHLELNRRFFPPYLWQFFSVALFFFSFVWDAVKDQELLKNLKHYVFAKCQIRCAFWL